jgi:hypothetical protein
MLRTESDFGDLAEAADRQLKVSTINDGAIKTGSFDCDDESLSNKSCFQSEFVGKAKFIFELDHSNGMVHCHWQGKNRHRKLIEVHPVVVKFVRENYFQGSAPYPAVLGFTEYKRDGKTYRAHPNYQSVGEWYDFAMILWQTKTVASPNLVSSEEFDPYDSPYGPEYVPAKILAFLQIIEPSTTDARSVAIVHSCADRDSCDVLADTRLLQQWTLEYGNSKKGVIKEKPVMYREPTLYEVSVDSIEDRILAIEESRGVRETLICKRNSKQTVLSRKVLVVKDRDSIWPLQFENWDSAHTRKYENI